MEKRVRVARRNGLKSRAMLLSMIYRYHFGSDFEIALDNETGLKICGKTSRTDSSNNNFPNGNLIKSKKISKKCNRHLEAYHTKVPDLKSDSRKTIGTVQEEYLTG